MSLRQTTSIFRTVAIDRLFPEAYIVQMKYVTASEARKNWFSLLDEAVKGHVIAIDRKGTTLVLRAAKAREPAATPEKIVRGKDLENADRWGWNWDSAGKLVPTDKA